MVPMVRAAALIGYKNLLRSYGVDTEELMSGLSLSPDYLDRPDLLIPLETKVELLEVGARLSRCRYFGLKLAQQQNISMLGLVGLLIQQSTTLREALTTIASSIGLHVQALDVWLEETGGLSYYSFTYRPSSPSSLSRQHNDNTLALGYKIISFLLNEPLKLHGVNLRGTEPYSLVPYRDFFHAPVAFESESNGLVFDRGYLDTEIAGANPAMRGLINNFLKQKQLDDFEERLFWIITNLLPKGTVHLSEVADTLGMAPRTLQSRLHHRGLTFQQLLDRVRVEQVCSYMLKGAMSLTEIADLVGYSQISALTRGFKRIMGTSPTSWRHQHHPEAPPPARFVK